MSAEVVLLTGALYLGALFLLAWLGDARGPADERRGAPVSYTLGLCVYCTAWTFYGAVGEAAAHGFDYLAIYVGPSLVMLFGMPLIARMIRRARRENVATIADFISARYGKSRAIASGVTLFAVIGLLPYFALQLKAVSTSFEALTQGAASARSIDPDTTLLVALAMAGFTLLFGVRGPDANVRRRGLMLAVATESAVKLGAALLVGAGIFLAAFGNLDGFLRAAAEPAKASLFDFDAGRADWWAACLLSALAFLCLPRQFHVAVVENVRVADLRLARWATPLYLVLISAFVLPVAVAGLAAFPNGAAPPDVFMVALPREQGSDWLALAAFIGGLSAATGMIMVSAVALGTMVSNDVVVPALTASSRFRAALRRRPGPVLTAVRRFALLLIVALAYGFETAVGPSFRLAEMGLISFAAVAQFAPALIGGLVWRGATAAGAIAGLTAGALGWGWTILLPALGKAGWLSAGLLADGPFGLTLLSPVAFGGVELDWLSHGTLWSLGPNLVMFVLVSLLGRGQLLDISRRTGAAPAAELRALAERYVGRERAAGAFAGGPPAGDFVDATERLLAGALGPASARVVVASVAPEAGRSRADASRLLGEASRAILSRHELMRDVLTTLRQGVCAFDVKLRVTLWNPRFVELVDLPPDLVRIGTPLDDVVRYNEARREYGEAGDSLLARLASLAAGADPAVYERVRPDGSVLEIATYPMSDGGFLAVYTDVTERHAAAAALREANETLERRIAERTEALAAAKAMAERASRGKTQILAGAGHDLLQPLQAARLFLSALSERVSDPAVGQIEASLSSLEHLLGELLQVARLDSGATAPQPSDFRISDILDPLTSEFAPLAERRGLRLTVRPTEATVRSDPALLRRILQNFLSNAVRHTDAGRVLVGCRWRGERLRIEVWDTGPGVPDDKIGEIFEEFHQLDGARGRGAGLGLGLAIVDRLARLLGHEISVRSRAGRGACFAVTVPIGPEAAAPSPPAAGPRRDRLRGGRVLVIENDAAIAAALRDLLKGWGLEIVVAATPEAARAAFDDAPPDAILSDLHLDAGRTGLEAVAETRARCGAAIPAAILTADRDPALAASVEAAGCRLLHKPVRPGALRALIERMVAEGRRARRAEAATAAVG